MTQTLPLVLYDGPHYTVCITRLTGFVVQNKQTGKGVCLVTGYNEWIKAFNEAIDDQERHDLASAFYKNGRKD